MESNGLLNYLVTVPVGFYLFIVILRFLLQAVKADFYNPISQFSVKATNPFLKPLRRVVPGLGGYDMASVVLAVIVEFLAIQLLAIFQGLLVPIHIALLLAVLGTLTMLLSFYFYSIFIIVIASWVSPGNYNPALSLLKQVVDPIMRPIRDRMGGMQGFDLSPMIILFLIFPLKMLLVNIAGSTGWGAYMVGF